MSVKTRVDELLRKGVPVNVAIAQAVTEQASKVDHYLAARKAAGL